MSLTVWSCGKAMCARFLPLVIILSGCVSAGMLQVSETRDNLNRLQLGMSKAEVLKIMGDPRIREVFMDSDGEGIEVLFYQTEFVGYAVTPKEDALTPVLIKKNSVIGWGRNFYEARVKVDLHLTED